MSTELNREMAEPDIVTLETCPECGQPEVEVRHLWAICGLSSEKPGPVHIWDCPVCGEYETLVVYDCPDCLRAKGDGH